MHNKIIILFLNSNPINNETIEIEDKAARYLIDVDDLKSLLPGIIESELYKKIVF